MDEILGQLMSSAKTNIFWLICMVVPTYTRLLHHCIFQIGLVLERLPKAMLQLSMRGASGMTTCIIQTLLAVLIGCLGHSLILFLGTRFIHLSSQGPSPPKNRLVARPAEPQLSRCSSHPFRLQEAASLGLLQPAYLWRHVAADSHYASLFDPRRLPGDVLRSVWRRKSKIEYRRRECWPL